MFSMVATGPMCNTNQLQGAQNMPEEAVAATVGQEKLTYLALEQFIMESESRMAQQQGQLPFSMKVDFLYGPAAEQSVVGLTLLELARREGVDLSEKAMETGWNAQFERELEGAKQQLIAANKLKKDATPAEVDKALTDNFGADSAGLRKRVIDNFKSQLQKPDQASRIRIQAANEAVIAHFAAKNMPTEADLKKQYTVYVAKRILLRRTPNQTVDPTKRIEEIKKEIESGKIKFEAAMDRYSQEPPAEKKRVQDNVFELDGRTATLDESYAPVAALKPGQMAVITQRDSVSLFRLDSVKENKPADFDTNRAKYVKDYSEGMAIKIMQDKLKAIREEANLVTWKSAGWKTMFELTAFEQMPETASLPGPERKAKYNEFVTAAKAALSTDLQGKRGAALALFSAVSKLEGLSTPEEKKALAADKAQALEALLQSTENVEIRLQLAEIYAAQKDGAKTAENLNQAARVIFGDFESTGQGYYATINAKLAEWEKAKLIDAEAAKGIRASLEEWRVAKVETDKAKREAEAAQKKAEAEAKKAEEEAKKKGQAPPSSADLLKGSGQPK